MEQLPAELVLHILSFLVESPRDIVRLQLVSRRLLKFARDKELWHNICFDSSRAAVRLNEASTRPKPFPSPQALQIQRQAAAITVAINGRSRPGADGVHADEQARTPQDDLRDSRQARRHRAMANWDPSYPGDSIDWYGEYIARKARLSVSWLEQPPSREVGYRPNLEARGLGLHRDSRGFTRVLSPLEDGSLCLWDIAQGRAHCNGTVSATSKPGLLIGNSSDHAAGVDPVEMSRIGGSGPVECVSVDQARDKAYIAVGSGLSEVDLHTLQVCAYERFPFSISALSTAAHPLPLTVGTRLSLHLHDPRKNGNGRHPAVEAGTARLDDMATFSTANRHVTTDFYRLIAGDLTHRNATHFHPGPLSILHLFPSPIAPDPMTGEIFVAGRFPSILVYDRRTFPALRTTIHSGARLCSMTSVPYPYNAHLVDLMRQGVLSVPEVCAAKRTKGDTIIACGEYNGKGSLEFYGLDAPHHDSSRPHAAQSGIFKNRATAARSKLLSVAAHGTRLVVSDGDGHIRWIERDGLSLVRQWSINSYEIDPVAERGTIFSGAAGNSDVARKLLPVGGDERGDILVWTGEKIGVVGFGSGFEVKEQGKETLEDEASGYAVAMRRALELHANDVRRPEMILDPSDRPQTSRQVKRAYAKRIAASVVPEAERRRLARGAELDRRAERIKQKEKTRKENARKKAEKEAKEREARRRMGIAEQTKDGYISPRQTRLGAFVRKNSTGTSGDEEATRDGKAVADRPEDRDTEETAGPHALEPTSSQGRRALSEIAANIPPSTPPAKRPGPAGATPFTTPSAGRVLERLSQLECDPPTMLPLPTSVLRSAAKPPSTTPLQDKIEAGSDIEALLEAVPTSQLDPPLCLSPEPATVTSSFLSRDFDLTADELAALECPGACKAVAPAAESAHTQGTTKETTRGAVDVRTQAMVAPASARVGESFEYGGFEFEFSTQELKDLGG